MTRVDDISNSTTDDGKVQQVHNEYTETSHQSAQPSSSEQVFVPAQPQQGVAVHPPPQIVIQPQIIINPSVVYPPSQPQPQLQPPMFQPPLAPPVQHYPPAFQHNNHLQPPQPPMPNQHGWTTGLFGCMEDPENAIITLCCPCVTFGQLAAIIDNGRTSCETSGMIYTLVLCIILMPCIISCTYRIKLRARFGLIEDPASDCLTHLCCEYCALCQEYRELNNRGLNPSAGWMRNENVQSFNHQQQGMVPPPYQTMN